jgi:hypothetical protein
VPHDHQTVVISNILTRLYFNGAGTAHSAQSGRLGYGVSGLDLGSTQFLSRGYHGCLPGHSKAGRGAKHSPSSNLEIKNAWSYAAIPHPGGLVLN